ncbi:uncharacterized protein LOC142981062 isoform X3 [Anticarsia gemmatalis]|uniref:uncharacterized protein LOC142981062 isoform X3 n=1 Tax=Anticarsia gemmatalis TaxID=129554 RepID=UPI003F75D642
MYDQSYFFPFYQNPNFMTIPLPVPPPVPPPPVPLPYEYVGLNNNLATAGIPAPMLTSPQHNILPACNVTTNTTNTVYNYVNNNGNVSHGGMDFKNINKPNQLNRYQRHNNLVNIPTSNVTNTNPTKLPPASNSDTHIEPKKDLNAENEQQTCKVIPIDSIPLPKNKPKNLNQPITNNIPKENPIIINLSSRTTNLINRSENKKKRAKSEKEHKVNEYEHQKYLESFWKERLEKMKERSIAKKKEIEALKNTDPIHVIVIDDDTNTLIESTNKTTECVRETDVPNLSTESPHKRLDEVTTRRSSESSVDFKKRQEGYKRNLARFYNYINSKKEKLVDMVNSDSILQSDDKYQSPEPEFRKKDSIEKSPSELKKAKKKTVSTGRLENRSDRNKSKEYDTKVSRDLDLKEKKDASRDKLGTTNKPEKIIDVDKEHNSRNEKHNTKTTTSGLLKKINDFSFESNTELVEREPLRKKLHFEKADDDIRDKKPNKSKSSRINKNTDKKVTKNTKMKSSVNKIKPTQSSSVNDQFDLRSKLTRKRVSDQHSPVIKRRKTNNDDVAVPVKQVEETEPSKEVKRKTIRLVINIHCAKPDSLNNNDLDSYQDMSFLDDIDVDEIVNSLNMNTSPGRQDTIESNVNEQDINNKVLDENIVSSATEDPVNNDNLLIDKPNQDLCMNVVAESNAPLPTNNENMEIGPHDKEESVENKDLQVEELLQDMCIDTEQSNILLQTKDENIKETLSDTKEESVEKKNLHEEKTIQNLCTNKESTTQLQMSDGNVESRSCDKEELVKSDNVQRYEPAQDIGINIVSEDSYTLQQTNDRNLKTRTHDKGETVKNNKLQHKKPIQDLSSKTKHSNTVLQTKYKNMRSRSVNKGKSVKNVNFHTDEPVRDLYMNFDTGDSNKQKQINAGDTITQSHYKKQLVKLYNMQKEKSSQDLCIDTDHSNTLIVTNKENMETLLHDKEESANNENLHEDKRLKDLSTDTATVKSNTLLKKNEDNEKTGSLDKEDKNGNLHMDKPLKDLSKETENFNTQLQTNNGVMNCTKSVTPQNLCLNDDVYEVIDITSDDENNITTIEGAKNKNGKQATECPISENLLEKENILLEASEKVDILEHNNNNITEILDDSLESIHSIEIFEEVETQEIYNETNDLTATDNKRDKTEAELSEIKQKNEQNNIDITPNIEKSNALVKSNGMKEHFTDVSNEVVIENKDENVIKENKKDLNEDIVKATDDTAKQEFPKIHENNTVDDTKEPFETINTEHPIEKSLEIEESHNKKAENEQINSELNAQGTENNTLIDKIVGEALTKTSTVPSDVEKKGTKKVKAKTQAEKSPNPEDRVSPLLNSVYIRSLQYRIFLTFRNRITIFSSIHQGFSSRIYKCKDLNEGKYYALKVTKEYYRNAAIEVGLMLQDLQECTSKNSYFILEIIYSSGAMNEWFWLTDYYPKNLNEALVANKKSFHIDMVQMLSRQLVAAVNMLTNYSIVHTDIKPHHILLDSTNNKLKLAGFDRARYGYDLDVRPGTGTANYRAPEIILGFPADYAIDVWSTAVVMFEMATGQELFPGWQNKIILYKQLCTVGPIDQEMLDNSTNKDKYIADEKYMKLLNSDYRTFQNVYKNDRLGKTLFATYDEEWKRNRADWQVTKDTYKIEMLLQLLEQMLVMNPRYRMSISYVEANDFIQE